MEEGGWEKSKKSDILTVRTIVKDMIPSSRKRSAYRLIAYSAYANNKVAYFCSQTRIIAYGKGLQSHSLTPVALNISAGQAVLTAPLHTGYVSHG